MGTSGELASEVHAELHWLEPLLLQNTGIPCPKSVTSVGERDDEGSEVSSRAMGGEKGRGNGSAAL